MQLTSLSLALTRAGFLSFSPASLFAASEPGVWYDPSDIKLGWRYNLLTYTEQFDNAAWTKSGVTVAADAVVGPGAQQTADKIVASATTEAHNISRLYSLIEKGVRYTASFYLRAAEYSTASLRIANAGHGYAEYNVNLAGLGSGTLIDGTTAHDATASIEGVGDGWYLAKVHFTSATGANAGYIVQIAAPNQYSSYTGDGTSGIYIWGASLTTAENADRPYQKITDGVADYFTYQSQPVLFQDSAGTTPVTAVEQPVGLMLDKSKGLVLGSELVTNGGFDSATGWALGAGISITGSQLIFSSVASTIGASQILPSYVGGKMFQVIVDVASVTAGAFRIRLGGPADLISGINAAGVYTRLVTGETNTQGLLVLAAGVTSGVINSISVRELPGNHAFQATSTSRPVLSARKNLLVGTAVLSTQNVSVRAVGHILSFWGTGTVTLSGASTAGPLVGTGVDNRVYIEFTPTAGTLTLTVSGSVLKAQLEEVNETV